MPPLPGSAEAADAPDAATGAPIDDFIRSRFVEMFLGNGRNGQLGMFAAAAALAFIWFDGTESTSALAWLGLMLAVGLGRLRFTQRLVRHPDSRRSTRRIAALLAVNGLLMAVPLTAFADLGEHGRAAMTMILTAAAAASVATTAGYGRIFLAFAAPMLLPLAAAWAVLAGDGPALPGALGMGVLILMFLAYMSVVGRQAYAVFDESCRIRYAERERNAELNSALERADQASRAKTQFLAAASHDLRQPIHSMNALLAALSLRRLDERTREIVDLLGSVNQAMVGQLDGLLEISRLDAGVVRPELAALRLDEFAAMHHAMVAPVAAERGLRCMLVLDREVTVRTDRALLSRVLGNLTDNAMKFTSRGGLVEIALQHDGARAWLSVRDTGIGIAEAEHERIFQEFYQVGNVERDRSRGLGLGLSIVSRLCALLGAELRLSSRPGQGTTLSVGLTAVASGPAQTAGEAGPAALAGLSVLVIDDEAQVRDSMRLLLGELGCRVHLADGTAQARQVLAATRIDAALSDLRLREGDSGLVALHEVQAQQPWARVVLVSGDTAPDRIREAEAAGVPLLHKPVAVAKLLAALNVRVP
jgi:signal transduction histidine kinase